MAGEAGKHSLLVSTDVKRPAAIQQLAVVGQKAGTGVRVHDPAGQMDPVARAKSAVAEATNLGYDNVIIDSAGRLHIDDDLMTELEAIRDTTSASDLLYVADAMTGQDAIKSAGEFNRRLGVTGVVLTKLDGDARGGAALSVVAVVGVPIAFVGSGERLEDLEPFHADRVVSRVLGMGDVLSLIERAEQAIDVEDAQRLEEKVRSNEFTLEDFRDQLQAIKKMGPLEQIIGMLPGMGNLKQLAQNKPDDKQIGRVEAIISSMTPDERRSSDIINGSRRKRIARGSGTTVEEVNRLLKQFAQMRKMLKAMGGLAGGGGGSRKAKARLGSLMGRMIKEQRMLVVRMRKAGSKKRPFFRVVVTDSRTARDSSFVEIVGHYNPRTKPALVTIDRERINYWVGKGAQLSDTVRTLLARHLTPAPAVAADTAGKPAAEPTSAATAS